MASIQTVRTFEDALWVKTISLNTYKNDNREIFWYLDDDSDPTDYWGQDYIGGSATSSPVFQFEGLENNTYYTVIANIYDRDGNQSTHLLRITKRIKTEASELPPKPVSVDFWDWDSSNGSATARQTRAAYEAITTNGQTTDFSYKVWNDMCDKIVEIREALDADYSWTNTYGSYNNTIMTSSDKTLTASRFNALRVNIDDAVDIANLSTRDKTGYVKQYKGDPVYGSYFIRLTDVMNDIITMAL